MRHQPQSNNYIPDSDDDDLDSDEDRSVGATTFSRQMNNNNNNNGMYGSPMSNNRNRAQPTSPVDNVIKSIPEQVAIRLRRAAQLNQELQQRMFAAEEEVERLKQLEDGRFENLEEENRLLQRKINDLKEEVVTHQNSLIAADADYQSQAPLELLWSAAERSHLTHTRIGISTNKLASSPGARTRLGDP